MSPEKNMYTYNVQSESGQTWSFTVDVERSMSNPRSGYPHWVALPFHRCPECPMDPNQVACCPPALDLVDVIREFSDRSSTEIVDVRVTGPHREYVRRCDIQTALRSLLGLVMASSGCPHLSPLHSMARHHLPFADRLETARRTASTYLLAQYFLHQDGLNPDLELNGLRVLYDRLQSINTHFARRLRAAVRQDASVNAIAALASLANLVSFSLDEDLDGLRSFLRH